MSRCNIFLYWNLMTPFESRLNKFIEKNAKEQFWSSMNDSSEFDFTQGANLLLPALLKAVDVIEKTSCDVHCLGETATGRHVGHSSDCNRCRYLEEIELMLKGGEK